MKNRFINLPEKGKTISSQEIAEITGKRHDAILRDIRNLLKQGVDAHNFVETYYTDKSNRQKPCFQLTKKGSLILASGYDALLRERIIDRWEVLETEHQAEIKNPSLSIDKAITNYQKQGKSLKWIQSRTDGQIIRHIYTDTLKSHGVTKYGYATCTNAIYRPILSCTAKGFLKKNNLPSDANPRDIMSVVELMEVSLSEALASEGIERKDAYGNDQCANISEIAATNIANAVQHSRKAIG